MPSPLFLTGESVVREELINEDLFPEDDEDPYNDESDVPLDVVINHVISGGVAPLPKGFLLGADGNLARNRVVENAELDVVVEDLPLAQRRPKSTAKAPKFNFHGGDDMWEEH
ncbi:hypothetical protein B0H13DRAFT_1913553 [Mycena leptocephala]|nr:hypothetical protein B0H13DRAFT_1913553 [Mycena leptocephala]